MAIVLFRLLIFVGYVLLSQWVPIVEDRQAIFGWFSAACSYAFMQVFFVVVSHSNRTFREDVRCHFDGRLTAYVFPAGGVNAAGTFADWLSEAFTAGRFARYFFDAVFALVCFQRACAHAGLVRRVMCFDEQTIRFILDFRVYRWCFYVPRGSHLHVQEPGVSVLERQDRVFDPDRAHLQEIINHAQVVQVHFAVRLLVRYIGSHFFSLVVGPVRAQVGGHRYRAQIAVYGEVGEVMAAADLFFYRAVARFVHVGRVFK